MFRILQLHKSIRQFTSVTSNVARITANQQPSRFYASALAALKEEPQAPQTPSVQNILMDIQNNLKEYGRISNKLILNLNDCVAQADRVNSTQALAAIRCFTDLSVDMTPENRIKNVEILWNRLEKLCVHLEVGHYNALLRAYLDSDHDFNPTDFLAKMAENGVGPNRITYQFLVERYCQTGDVSGATRIMRFMEEKEVPITQNILNLMIMGHARNNDMENAEDVLNIMKAKGLSPDETTYGLLLSEYARKGDVDKIVNFFKDDRNRDVFLDSRTISNIIFQLVSNGHKDSVHKVLEAAPAIIRTEFHRLIHRLVSTGHHEACLPLLEQAQNYPDGFVNRLSAYLVGSYAGKEKSPAKIFELLNVVPKSEPGVLYMVALRALLAQGEVESALELISTMRKENINIRTHLHYPLVSQLAKKNNVKDLANVIVSLQNQVNRVDVYILYRVLRSAGWKIQPAIDALLPLRRFGVTVRDCLVTALNQRHPVEAQELASQPLRTVVCAANALTTPSVLRRFPENAFLDVSCDIIARGARGAEDSESDAEVEAADSTSTSASAAAGISGEAESISEDAEEVTSSAIPFLKLLQMAPQELADFIISGIVKNLRFEDKCVRLLNGLQERGIGISKELCDELSQEVNKDKIKEALQKLAAGKSTIPDRNFNMFKISTRSDIFEEYLKNEKITDPYLRNLLQNKMLIGLCEENNSRAVEVMKQIGDKVLPSSIGAFIRYACNNDDTALGLECWSKYSKMRGASMHFVNLAINLIKEGKIDDAVKILTEKKVNIASKPHYKVVQNLMVILSTSEDERCLALLKELSTDGSDRKLYVGHMNMLIENDQLVEAVDLLENSLSKYGRYGLRNLGVVLVEKEKYELLQRVQNILTAAFGEEESLFELSLVLLKCRKVRQAKRIVEMSGQPGRVVARVLTEGDLASLESLVEVLPTFHARRDELCEKLVAIYDKKNDAESALVMYTRFEEEKYTPSHKFLFTLRNLLARCGYEIPFDTSVLADEPVSQPSSQPKSSTQPKPSSQKSSRPKPVVKAPEQPTKSMQELEADVYSALNKDRTAVQDALRQVEATRRHELADDLIRDAIRQKNFERFMLVLPVSHNIRFGIFQRILEDETMRKDYVEFMESHIHDMSDMLKAYWFNQFFKGNDKLCEDLWLQHSLYNMIYPPKYGFDVLRGHEERYFAFFDKIQAPPQNKIGAFVGLVRKKIAENTDAALELLQKEAKLISHVNGLTLQKIRTLLVEGKASSEALSKFDALVKEHGINVTKPSS